MKAVPGTAAPNDGVSGMLGIAADWAGAFLLRNR